MARGNINTISAGGAVPILGKTLTADGTAEYDVTTPVQVVNAAYSTEGNGGRKLVRLDDGTLVSAVHDGITTLYFYESSDNGLTWSVIYSVGMDVGDISIVTDGTYIHALYTRASALRASYMNNTSGTFVPSDIEDQTAIGNCSLAIAPNGDLHATWSSKNASYPNGFNIRYSKSTDGGVTWDAPTQVSANSVSGNNYDSPTIVTGSNGFPNIIFKANLTTTKYIFSYNWTGTNWQGPIIVYNGGTYIQDNPSADVLSDGTIVVAWHGKDATDLSRDNIRFSQSTDNGVTWSTMEKLTSGNTVDRKLPSITRDDNDYPYISYDDNGTLKFIYNNGTWQTAETIATGTNVATLNNHREFTKPMAVYMGATDVKFYGKWSVPNYINTTLVEKVKSGSYVYCNEPTELTLDNPQDVPDLNQVSLLHMDGTDASTTFTDESGKVWTANGNAQIDTAQSKFGGASGLFDGTGDWIDTPASDDFNLGSNDFTIDFWFRPSAIATNYICGQVNASNISLTQSFRFYILGGVANASFSDGTSAVYMAGTSSVTVGVWMHISAVRVSGTITLYINGISESTASLANIQSSAYKVSIGRAGEFAASYFAGHLDEFRFINGEAKWTANFTPPTSAYTGLVSSSTQSIPSVSTATAESEMLTLDSGVLKSTGSVDKQYVGNNNKDSLGFTVI